MQMLIWHSVHSDQILMFRYVRDRHGRTACAFMQLDVDHLPSGNTAGAAVLRAYSCLPSVHGIPGTGWGLQPPPAPQNLNQSISQTIKFNDPAQIHQTRWLES